jgi:excisionase family DNA binding protein
MPLHKNLHTRKEVADYFGITFPTLKKLINNGTIRAYRLGKRKILFKITEIESALKLIPNSKKRRSHG